MDELHVASVAAEQFCDETQIIEVAPYGSGNVHRTYVVRLRGGGRFILQQLNTRVFPRPDLVMENIRKVTEHLSRTLEAEPLPGGRRWEVPALLPSRDGASYWLGPDRSFWRALRFIDGQCYDAVGSPLLAREIGWALGTFHRLVSDLPADELADTLRGFHVTPAYLRRYDEVRSALPASSDAEADRCIRFIETRREWAGVLEEARAEGRLDLRPIHGDPKANNVVIGGCGEAVGLIDLDTVKPGLVQYDIGDCLRSGCNRQGEETAQWRDVRFDLALCRATLFGYFSAAGAFLTPSDRELLFDSVRLIAFELGLRFFTDYLEGDVYFRVGRPKQNLLRALVQFRLAESIEEQENDIRAIVREVGP